MPNPETIEFPLGNKLFYLFIQKKVKIISGWFKCNQNISCWTTWFRYINCNLCEDVPILLDTWPKICFLASDFGSLKSQMPSWASFQFSLYLCLVNGHKITQVAIACHHDNINNSYKACPSDLSLLSVYLLSNIGKPFRYKLKWKSLYMLYMLKFYQVHSKMVP